MKQKILNIVSGAKSGALNVAVTIGDFLKCEGFKVKLILRKYNKAGIAEADVIKDCCTVDYIYCLAKLIDAEKPDIIMVHGYSTHLWTKLALLKANHRARLIHIEHNVERYTKFRVYLLKKLDCCTEKYICVSEGVANSLRKFNLPDEKIQVIYNGIDINKFAIEKQPHSEFTIGMVARFTKQKDQMTLIKAVEILTKIKKIPVKLILMGEGKLKEQCMEYVKKHNLAETISFETGFFTDLIPRIDLFVLSTHYEGLPLVLCEAMAAKLPVIATNVAGVNEIVISKETGMLVKENNSVDLAEKIEEARQGKNLYIEKAYQKVNEQFSFKNMCEEYKAIVRN
ncbi:glycosyltransferase [Anaerosinus sp.]|uniref:glycosyltransferase n=1 Tax=Selenobaculum sp. TaxID=3074374 RepID=UPI003AB6FF4A